LMRTISDLSHAAFSTYRNGP